MTYQLTEYGLSMWSYASGAHGKLDTNLSDNVMA